MTTRTIARNVISFSVNQSIIHGEYDQKKLTMPPNALLAY
ncbi:MAG: hypothetical protein ACI9SP_001511 [Arenicella sp.]|jgi:hypothetical protein